MRHLVIGASGQIGEQLVKTLVKNREEVIGTFFATPLNEWNIQKSPGKIFSLDITKESSVEHLIADVNPDVIYIPAANTRVDYCEEEPESTWLVNVIGVKNIVTTINNIRKDHHQRIEPLLVFFSSDYLFNGEHGPYNEGALPDPICEYGRQKLAAEHYISTQSNHFIILRTSGVFGPESQGKNFVLRLAKNLSEGKEAIVPCDEFGTPTYAPSLADATFKIVKNASQNFRAYTTQIINLAGPKTITRYEFAKNIAEAFGYDTNLIKPAFSGHIKRAAKRPLKAGLTTDKLDSIVGRKLLGHLDALKELKQS
jgi:dTDP-4-dehydrorhamnose reductase